MARREGATVGELALAVVTCPRCGAAPGENCAAAMKRTLEGGGTVEGAGASPAERETALRELDELARSASQLMHPERLKEAEAMVDSAVAYGLVERVR